MNTYDRIAFRVLAAVVVAGMIGCEKEPLHTDTTNNPQIEVSLLFEHDGCRAYRFVDGDRRYYVTCQDGATTTSWREVCGKNCTRDVEIPAVRR